MPMYRVQNFVLHPCVSVLMQPGCHISTVHVSPEGINCCELNDSSVVFLQPLMQRRRRSGDKWEVVFQSVFVSLCPIAVHITLSMSFTQHTSLPLLPFCPNVCVSVTVMQQVLVGNGGMPFQARLSSFKKKQTVAPSITYHLLSLL